MKQVEATSTSHHTHKFRTAEAEGTTTKQEETDLHRLLQASIERRVPDIQQTPCNLLLYQPHDQ